MIRWLEEGIQKMKFTKQTTSFGQNAPNTSARAPGSNGPGPIPAQGALVQAGITKVVANPGDPNFSDELAAKQRTHSKSNQVPTHPAHCDRPQRGSRGDGKLVLEAGAAAAGECNDWAGE
jgi:hypothetical protein